MEICSWRFIDGNVVVLMFRFVVFVLLYVDVMWLNDNSCLDLEGYVVSSSCADYGPWKGPLRTEVPQ